MSLYQNHTTWNAACNNYWRNFFWSNIYGLKDPRGQLDTLLIAADNPDLLNIIICIELVEVFNCWSIFHSRMTMNLGTQIQNWKKEWENCFHLKIPSASVKSCRFSCPWPLFFQKTKAAFPEEHSNKTSILIIVSICTFVYLL